MFLSTILLALIVGALAGGGIPRLADLKRSIEEGIASGDGGVLDLDAIYGQARKTAKR